MSRFLRLFEPLSRNCGSWTKKLAEGPSLEAFIANSSVPRENYDPTEVPYLIDESAQLKKVFFEVYGCQMNVNDTEIVWSILKKKGYERVLNHNAANVVLIMTCSIREGAEQKIWRRLQDLRKHKQRRDLQVGVLGCMAERLKTQLLEKEKSVDVVAGPDSYRDLPRLLETASGGQAGVNVQLSLDETYADVTPVRLDERRKTAFVSIMRGCNNMCTYCIVPFTRGRERSRPMNSILDEVRHLSLNGVKEVTLLGQNVNSYRDMSEESHPFIRFTDVGLAKGFKSKCKLRSGGLGFADLLHQVAEVDPEMRVRFTSPHPKDFPDEVLQVISSHKNICNHIHLPAQSGSTRVLDLMGRGYTREDYLTLVDTIYKFMPNVSLTSDFITGFCGETEDEHQMTLSLVEQVGYTFCYAFPYSLREKTRAHRRLEDDVPLEDKKRRAIEILEVFRRKAKLKFEKQIGDIQTVLVEGESKRSTEELFGRNEGNTKVIIANEVGGERIHPGEYVSVRITNCSSQTMIGEVLRKTSLQSSTDEEEKRQMIL
ncbi:CDK5 regulatory subunit-associated protein 1 [Galendromus occidentalis]|uniref:CDK5RAP1-like protein n=1 Tax=Galendromus occidentalis TaxID=34638 RepID=A0AAJ6QX23_9ACAR|nr:CDK5 regulatory subunit-associated protein 1 [Galendromus occidentalis]